MIKEFPVLYTRTSNNQIQQWNIIVEDLGNTAVSSSYEGLVETGNLSRTQRITKVGKNVGKMNQTTPFEQACKESESRWKRKLKQGYKESIAEVGELKTDNNGNLKPMKAQQYFKDNGEVCIKFPCYGQNKLNGIRCMGKIESKIFDRGTLLERTEQVLVFRSKEGLEYDQVQHINDELTPLLNLYESTRGMKIILDGEMYIHGELLQDIRSAVVKANSNTRRVKFHIFDLAIPELTQKQRKDILDNIGFQWRDSSVTIIEQSYIIHNNEDAQSFTDQAISNGYEGAIFRDMKATYQFGKRASTMTKLKRSQDVEFEIIDVVGGDNSPELGIFVCLAENGLEFKATPEGNADQKKEYLTNKHLYIGKKLTIRFFERTKDGKPFHAVGVIVRNYE